MKELDNVYTLIEQYLANEMGTEDKADFERQMTENSTLKDLVEVQKDINETILEEDVNEFADLLTQIDQKIHGGSNSNSAKKVRPLFGIKPQYYMAIAAAVVIIFGIVFFTNEPVSISGEEIYSQYYDASTSPRFSTRGTAKDLRDSLKKVTQASFDLGTDAGYENAIETFKLLVEESDSSKVFKMKCYYYMAISYLEIKKEDHTEKAIELFDIIIASNEPTYKPMSEWTKALVLFKKGNKDEGIIILKSIVGDSNHVYYKKAKEILTSLGVEP